MVDVSDIYAIGFKGHISVIAPYEELYKHNSADDHSQGHKAKYMSPEIVTYFGSETKWFEVDRTDEKNQVRDNVSSIYDEYDQYGPFGDVIKLTRIDTGQENVLYTYSVGRKDFIKPGVAADLGVFVKGRNEDNESVVYMVTGIRRNDPGKGQAALFGGFCDIDGYVLDSPFYTILHEAEEEANLPIHHSDLNSLRENYEIEEAQVSVTLGEDENAIEKDATMYRVGTMATGDEEKLLALGQKRVYVTTGFVLPLDMGQTVIDEKLLETWFEAGDDIADLSYHNVTPWFSNEPSASLPEFGISHHRILATKMAQKAANIFNKDQ